MLRMYSKPRATRVRGVLFCNSFEENTDVKTIAKGSIAAAYRRAFLEKVFFMKPKWTQDEAIAFECARECINDMIGICSSEIADEEEQEHPNQVKIAEIEARRFALAIERCNLTLKDQKQIARVRKEYGAWIRNYRNQS